MNRHSDLRIFDTPPPKTVLVKVSAAMLRQRFHPCTPGFVHEVCLGRCCENKSTGIRIAIHPSEHQKFLDIGAVITDGFLLADDRGLCPFKTDDGRCSIHLNKPMGCRFSPFTLTKKGTLIVRNRYRRLRCYQCPGSVPAYHAHRWSLTEIFGEEETQRIIIHMDTGGGDTTASMSILNYSIMRDNSALYKGV